MTTASEPAASPPFTQRREFWALIAYAIALGVFGALTSLVFMGVVGFGGAWYTDSDPELVRGAVVVDRGHRGSGYRRGPAASADPATREDPQPRR